MSHPEIWIATAAAVVLVLAAELLHGRRTARVAALAFGPVHRPALWTALVLPARAAGTGLVVWGLTTLLLAVEPRVHVIGSVGEEEQRHMVLVLDVSPSMRLNDAGPTGEQQRQHRARDLLDSLFGRVSMDRYRVSVIATYNGARPVVIDTRDPAVLDNILTDLPMHYAFEPGRTKLFDGLAEAAKVAADWEPGSTLLVVVSDGDTVPATGMPAMPRSVDGILVVGVGDPTTGSFIDGRQSRQDVSALRQIAVRLGGAYHDGNTRHIPTDLIRAVTGAGETTPLERLTLREYALLAVALGASLLAGIPWLLRLFGTAWRPGVRRVGSITPIDTVRPPRRRAANG